MPRKNRLFCNVMLLTSMMTLAAMNTEPAEAYQRVKLQQRQLVVDFEMDGFYEPFFVKGVGYAPVPIGKFMGYGDGWSAVCRYVGPFPLQYPELRFEPGSASPDGVYTCGPNGEKFYDDSRVFNRDFPLIKDMNANTVRTWGDVTPALMQKANEYGLKVIAGYWVDHNIDYTFSSPDGPQQRQTLIDGFVNYVNTFKNDPALLMWGLSNENNLDFCDPCVHGQACDRTAQAAGYYQLMNDMALAVKQAEGASFHPVMIVSAELTEDLINFATSYMPAVDIIGINAYRGSSFDGFPVGEPNLFDEFELNFPEKSMIVTEFGADAWNSGDDPEHPENGVEDQISQAIYISSAWDEIAQNATVTGGPVNGGVVFHYSDSWNGYSQRPAGADPDDSCVWFSSDWTPSVMTHDHNYTDPDVFGIGIMPDNKVNPEWWGMMSVEKNWLGAVCDAPSDVDCVYPREAYHALRQQFALSLDPEPDLVMTSVGISAQSVTQGDNVTFTGTVKNQGGMDAQPAFCVYFYLSTDTTIDPSTDKTVAWDCQLTLSAGASHDTVQVMPVPFDLPAGTYYVGAIADPYSKVDEGDETNNTLVGNAVSLTVGVDLAMTSFQGPSEAYAGGGYIPFQETVVNSGTAPTTYCTVSLYLSSDSSITTADIYIGYHFCGDGGKLAPGVSWTSPVNDDIPSDVPAGTYYLGAIADGGNLIQETNEANNAVAGNLIKVLHPKNGNFESQVSKAYWKFPSSGSIDQTVFHSGAKSAKIAGVGKISTDAAWPINVTAGKKYKISGWIKTNVISHSSLTSYGAGMRIRWYSATGATISYANIIGNLKGTLDWTSYNKTLTAPAGAVAGRLEIGIAGSGTTGTAWFDDIVVEGL